MPLQTKTLFLFLLNFERNQSSRVQWKNHDFGTEILIMGWWFCLTLRKMYCLTWDDDIVDQHTVEFQYFPIFFVFSLVVVWLEIVLIHHELEIFAFSNDCLFLHCPKLHLNHTQPMPYIVIISIRGRTIITFSSLQSHIIENYNRSIKKNNKLMQGTLVSCELTLRHWNHSHRWCCFLNNWFSSNHHPYIILDF